MADASRKSEKPTQESGLTGMKPEKQSIQALVGLENNLTDHFAVEDLTQSHHGLENVCPLAYSGNLVRVAQKLEEARSILGAAAGKEIRLRVTYGFRCPEENRACGSTSKTSAHLEALAADVVPVGMSLRDAFDILSEHPTFMSEVDQLIIERGCLHIGLPVSAHQFVARHELRLDLDIGGVRKYPLFGHWTPQGVIRA